ncbi:MAG: CHASE2 domain-containing protein, partial [Thermoleophilaceae bacterium]
MAVAVLVVVRLGAEIAPVMRRPDLVLLDFWQSLRGTNRPSPQVVIVAIDEKSIARFGPPAWPRSEYVPLIERLANSGARVIGFDFTFAALEREAENNKLLARAMKEAGNVVFGYEFTELGDPSPPGARASAVLQANALARFESPAIPPALSLIEPEPVLAEAAAAMGHVLTVVSEDGRIRVVPLFNQHGEKAYPSLALQTARVYTETPMEEVELMNGVVRMGAWDIPVSASGEVLLNWPAAGAQAFPWYSFLDVMRGDVPDEAFRGKAVLVAGTASRLDDRGPPFALDVPGVLIYATFLDNVFRFDFVQAPTWAFLLEWGLFFVACGLGVWLLPRLSMPLLLIGVPALSALLFGAAAFLFVQKGIWLKVVYPIFALLVPLGLLVALRLTASERETHDIAAEKLENQKLLGLSFQEKGMLDKMVFDADPGFEDVATRMERLSQAGTNVSLFPSPTAHAGPVSTPAQAAPESPLAHLLPTIVEDDEAPIALSARAPSGPSQPPPAPPPTPAPRSPTPPPRSLTGAVGSAVTPAPGGPVLPGSRFGRYEVEQHLGRGGMGDVYLVRDTVINRKAALKTIRPDTDLDPRRVITMRQRFYREAQTAGNLTHPNIVTIYDVGEDLGMSY